MTATSTTNPARVLLVKHTSMGDVIHALTALTDAWHALPDIQFDWSINAGFADVARWHPAVRRIITNDHRKWRRHPVTYWRNGEIKTYLRELRQETYDCVIDGQTNFKSALATRIAKSPVKCGYDKADCAESIAHLAYNHKYAVDKNQHAITRLRQLFAASLGYTVPDTPPDFGIDRSRFIRPAVNLPEKYLLFIHNASWQTKLWPEQYWQQLIKLATGAGYHVLLPAGNAEEQERSSRLATGYAHAWALPRLSLSELGYIIQYACGAVSVDTGLSHLVGALDRPGINMYGATDSRLIGVMGANQKLVQGTYHCAPCYRKKCIYADADIPVHPPCFEAVTPAWIWEELSSRLHD